MYAATIATGTGAWLPWTVRQAPRGLGMLVYLATIGEGCGRVGEPFVSGVYLQDITATEAVVAIATRHEVAIRVTCDEVLAGEGHSQDLVEESPRLLHAVQFSGLTPDTLYHYQVEDDEENVLGESTFQTAPLGGGRAVTFVAIGDTGQVDETEDTFKGEIADVLGNGPSNGKQRLVVNAILRSSPQPELLIHTGDVLQGSGERRFYRDAFFKPFGPLIDHTPIFPAMGNHDAGTKRGAAWLDAFTTPANNAEKSERYYSFDWGDIHFVALDLYTSAYESGSPQGEFLDADLANCTAAWKVVYFHRPPFSDIATKLNLLPPGPS